MEKWHELIMYALVKERAPAGEGEAQLSGCRAGLGRGPLGRFQRSERAHESGRAMNAIWCAVRGCWNQAPFPESLPIVRSEKRPFVRFMLLRGIPLEVRPNKEETGAFKPSYRLKEKF